MIGSPKFFMAGSVLLNLLLAGIIIGHMVSAEAPKHYTVAEIAHRLPEDKREHFTTVMLQSEHDTGELRAQLNGARNKAAELLKTEPFDKTAYLAQVQQAYQLYGQILQHTYETVAGLAEQSTPQERAVFADTLRRLPRPSTNE